MPNPTYAQISGAINTVIVTNHDNLITAAVLNPILIGMLNFTSTSIGDLDQLNTTDKSTLVSAINEALAKIDDVNTGIKVLQGLEDPNSVPPTEPYAIGDLYSQTTIDGDPIELYIYTGTTWYLLNTPNLTEVIAQGGDINISMLNNDGNGVSPYATLDDVGSQLDNLQDSDFFKREAFEKTYIAAATSENIRNSEGDILVLNNGNYLSVYTRFGLDSTDQAPASIRGKISADNTGKSWGNEFIVSKNIGSKNVLSVSLLRVNSTTIHCFFLVRNSVTDLGLWRVVSTDEGLTWSSAVQVINDGYTDILSSVVKRSNGNRILISGESVPDASDPVLNWDIFCYRSDDNGLTYTKSNIVNVPTSSGETSVCWLGGNNILFSTRSTSGFQWFTKSTDNGTTLGTPYQSTLQSVDAPAQIINYAGTLIALHNPNTVSDVRNPLTISKSTDSGDTWEKITDLENFNNGSNDVRFSYPSLTLDGDNLLISYFELAGNLGRISLKFSKINIPDLLLDVKPSMSGADNIYLPNLVLNDASDVSPTDDVTDAIAKLQTQINQLKGFRYEYNGIGEAIALINNDPSNELENLYITYRNTNGVVVSELGHIGADGNFYIYSTKPVTILSPKTINEGDAIFHGKLGVGTDNPLQLAVFSRGGNEGLEIAADDPVNRLVSVLAYDRAAGEYRPINFSALSFNFDNKVTVSNDIEITDATKGIILRSPDNTRYRVTVSNVGLLLATAI